MNRLGKNFFCPRPGRSQPAALAIGMAGLLLAGSAARATGGTGQPGRMPPPAVQQAAASASAKSTEPPRGQVFPRVTVDLYGVFSPRGFFNIMVRVNQLRGVTRAKLDLKESRLTLDFAPGVMVDPTEIREVMVNAGYRPGPFKIDEIPISAPPDNRPGWVKIKHPTSHSALVRWLEVNF